MDYIALIGKSGAGKSTVANIIANHLSIPHLKTGVICRDLAVTLFGNDSKDNTQLLDDALTKIDPSIFLNATLRNSKGWGKGCVIDALRFDADYKLVREKGFIVVRVVCADEQRKKRLKSRKQSFSKKSETHISETELDHVDVDFEITNSLSVNDLTLDTLKVLTKLNAK